MKALKHLLISFTLLNYVFLAIFGLIAMEYVHMDMPMNAPMSHCPFMAGEQSLCAMTLADHIVSWQQSFRAVPLMVFILLVPILGTYFILLSKPPNLFSNNAWKKRVRDNFYTRLFSQGILNPKLY